jgi:hypothetical protein
MDERELNEAATSWLRFLYTMVRLTVIDQRPPLERVLTVISEEAA